jgi:D-methionine transport system ATP-binding protein
MGLQMIEIKTLIKTYNDVVALKEINLVIRKGTIFGIAGRSGTGKSTLLRCINGIEAYESGMIIVDGVDVGVLSPTGLVVKMGNENAVWVKDLVTVSQSAEFKTKFNDIFKGSYISCFRN